MASPLFKQIKKALSPRSPIMRLKSPFKRHVPKHPCTLAQTPHRRTPTIPPITPASKKLFDEGESSLSIQVPKVRHVLTLETNVSSLLERGIEEKNFFVLGKGTFGTVILSRLKGEQVAVKVVKRNQDQCSITRELNSLVLSHPNVVDAFQVIHNPNKPFGVVVMEAWSPLTLQSVIQDSININFEDCVRLLIGITKALDYCHDVGIVHLDVKPKNILIDLKEKQSKLCDFGSSHNLKSNTPFSLIQVCGTTIAYTAPELLKGKPVTEKCDVYSFGITMWQILHKENPYPGIDSHIIIYQVVANHFRPQTTVHNADIKGFIKLYERCWQEDPSARPSMSVVGTALQTML